MKHRLILLIGACTLWLLLPEIAYADNCDSLSDCYGTLRAALAAAVGTGLFAVLISAGLDFLPGVGTIKGVIQADTGRDLVTGDKLALWERMLGLVPFAVGIMGAAMHIGQGMRAVEHAADAARAAEHAADAAWAAEHAADAARAAEHAADAARAAEHAADAARAAEHAADVARAAEHAADVARAAEHTPEAALAAERAAEHAAEAALAAERAAEHAAEAARAAEHTAEAARAAERTAEATQEAGHNPATILGGSQGPGEWLSDFSVNNMREADAAYQQYATGAPRGKGYYVNGVQFDGYDGTRLLDAKNFRDDGMFIRNPYYQINKGYSLLNDARRQLAAAGNTPIQWRVAGEEAARLIQRLFENYHIPIDVVYWP